MKRIIAQRQSTRSSRRLPQQTTEDHAKPHLRPDLQITRFQRIGFQRAGLRMVGFPMLMLAMILSACGDPNVPLTRPPQDAFRVSTPRPRRILNRPTPPQRNRSLTSVKLGPPTAEFFQIPWTSSRSRPASSRRPSILRVTAEFFEIPLPSPQPISSPTPRQSPTAPAAQPSPTVSGSPLDPILVPSSPTVSGSPSAPAPTPTPGSTETLPTPSVSP